MKKQLFAIFGDPVSHSRSPLMHNYLFSHLGVDACYTRVHLHDGSKLRQTFFDLGLSGANITVPFKEDAYKACDEVRGFAKTIKVVNTIINENGKLIGYNTDADGFIQAIEDFEGIKEVLIIGAGGTAKALAIRLRQSNLNVSVLNRTAGRLSYFQEMGLQCHDWESFQSQKYDLVINTTSAGLTDESLPAPSKIIEQILQNSRYACDVIYGTLTPFLKMVQMQQLQYKDGSDMLLYQGVLASHLFCGERFTTMQIADVMKQSFELM